MTEGMEVGDKGREKENNSNNNKKLEKYSMMDEEEGEEEEKVYGFLSLSFRERTNK